MTQQTDTFGECFKRYDIYRQAYARNAEELIELKQAVQEVKARLTAIESEKLVNGEITGSNAEARKASLTALLAVDERYQREVLALREAEAQVARIEAERDDAANGMSQYRRGMDFAIATRNLEAAVKAGLGLEREYSHG